MTADDLIKLICAKYGLDAGDFADADHYLIKSGQHDPVFSLHEDDRHIFLDADLEQILPDDIPTIESLLALNWRGFGDGVPIAWTDEDHVVSAHCKIRKEDLDEERFFLILQRFAGFLVELQSVLLSGQNTSSIDLIEGI
jgi:hypothetical protein